MALAHKLIQGRRAHPRRQGLNTRGILRFGLGE
jgi:hypothetical protein